MQSDIRRLKDYIAYKVDHAADERDLYRALPVAPTNGLQRSLDKELLDDDEDNGGDIDDNEGGMSRSISGEFKNGGGGNRSKRGTVDGSSSSTSTSTVRFETMKLELDDFRNRLDKSETESAVLIGRIVAEKESLTGDRELLLEQLNKGIAEAAAAEETITNLRALVADANITSKCAVNDLLICREKAAEREKDLQGQCHRERERTILLTEQLRSLHSERDQLQGSGENLHKQLIARDETIAAEQLGREKDRAALMAALNGIDELTAQVEVLRERDLERERALERIFELNDEVCALCPNMRDDVTDEIGILSHPNGQRNLSILTLTLDPPLSSFANQFTSASVVSKPYPILFSFRCVRLLTRTVCFETK